MRPTSVRGIGNDDAEDPGSSGRCVHSRALYRKPGRRSAERGRAHRSADARDRARAQQRRHGFHPLRRSEDHNLRARFFTPRTEAGFVGHATVAAHTCSHAAHEAPTRLRQKSKAGTVDIEVRGTAEERSIAIRQSTPPLGRELNDRERLAVLDALALATDDLDPRCPMRIVGSSSTRLMIGVRGQEPLRHLKPDMTSLTTLSAQIGAAGYFVFALMPAEAII